jgi:hypothetical protein
VDVLESFGGYRTALQATIAFFVLGPPKDSRSSSIISDHKSVAMPRTAALRSSKRAPIPFDQQLARENELSQLIFWHYYDWLDTDGEHGWNPAEQGQKHHWTSSTAIHHGLSKDQFTSRAKKMVKLARAYKEAGK